MFYIRMGGALTPVAGTFWEEARDSNRRTSGRELAAAAWSDGFRPDGRAGCMSQHRVYRPADTRRSPVETRTRPVGRKEWRCPGNLRSPRTRLPLRESSVARTLRICTARLAQDSKGTPLAS